MGTSFMSARASAFGGAAASLALCAAGAAEASPWNREAGQSLTISRVAYHAAEAPGRRFEQVTSETYFEVGLSDRFMLGGKASYAWQGLDQTPETGPVRQDALSGLAEGSVFVQGTLHRWDGGVLSAVATAHAPTETASRIGTDRAFSRDAALGAALSLGLSREKSFLAARLGTEHSLGRDADFLRGEVTFGRNLPGGAMMLLDAYATHSLGGAAPEGVDYDLYQLAPSLVLPVRRRWRLQLGATWDVAGRAVDPGAGGFVALWMGR